jgi:two-component system OmpR family response regulator
MARTILVVDDDPATNDQYARFLKLDGFDVVTAFDGEEALRKAAACRPDLIVSDLCMPGLDGLQLLTAVRSVEALKHVPVVVVTGDYFVDDGTAARLHELGAEIRFKPLWIEDLARIVERLIRAGSVWAATTNAAADGAASRDRVPVCQP